MKAILRLVPVFALAFFSGNSFATKLTLTALGGMQMNNGNSGKIGVFSSMTGVTDNTAISQFGFQGGGGLGLEFTNFGFRGMGLYQQSISGRTESYYSGATKSGDTLSSWSDVVPGGDLYFITGDPKKGFRFLIGAGGEAHLAKLRVQFTPVTGTGDTLVATGVGFGAKGFIGFHIMFSEAAGLVVEGGYRYAMVNEFKATENLGDVSPNIPTGSVVKKFNSATSSYSGENIKLDLSAPYLQTGLVFKF